MIKKQTFPVALLVIFIDYMGIGLIYPLFSSMIFDPQLPLVAAETSSNMRGLYLGLLLGMMPFFQFFSAPVWGAISDKKGRRGPLLISLCSAIGGYFFLLLGASFASLLLLFLGRCVVGLASGNSSIIQACIADMSDKKTKARHFALYSMAMGSGFTLGPFFGGVLSATSYSLPFLFTLLLLFFNFLLAYLFFEETSTTKRDVKITIKTAFSHIQKAFELKSLRILLLASFIHCYGWSFFFEFVPIYFIKEFSFSTLRLGLFYAAAGAFYAVSTGYLIQPLLKRFSNEILFVCGNILTGLFILGLLFIPSAAWLWICMFFISYFVAFVSPTSTTMISNSVDAKYQGESLGILSSVNAAAFVLSPLFSGSLVGGYPSLSIKIGGLCMILAGLTLLISFKTLNIRAK